MPKIIVIGCPGAGKSMFSRNLSNVMHLPVYLNKDMNDLYN